MDFIIEYTSTTGFKTIVIIAITAIILRAVYKNALLSMIARACFRNSLALSAIVTVLAAIAASTLLTLVAFSILIPVVIPFILSNIFYTIATISFSVLIYITIHVFKKQRLLMELKYPNEDRNRLKNPPTKK